MSTVAIALLNTNMRRFMEYASVPLPTIRLFYLMWKVGRQNQMVQSTEASLLTSTVQPLFCPFLSLPFWRPTWTN